MLFRMGDFMNKKKILKKKFRDNFANCFTSPISTLVYVYINLISLIRNPTTSLPKFAKWLCQRLFLQK